MKALLIAEKPSLMNDIRNVYRSHQRELGFSIDFLSLHGHVLSLKEPRDLNEKYKKWNINDYPVTFDYVYYVPKGDYQTVQEVKSGLREDYDFIIHAGDPDQEGQLLVDEVLIFLKNNKPVKRFWTNDTTEEGILQALKNLRPNAEYFGFYQAALTRQHLDFQFGMNLTVAGTVKYAPFKTVYKLGRVKAAILSITTERENQIINFVPKTTYKKAFRYKEDEFVNDKEYENKDFVLPDSATVSKVAITEKTVKAPKLFKLSTLQSECYKQFGWSAKQTLSLLQELYEKHLVSYPRTDCEYLSTNIDLVRILGRDYPKTDKDYFNDKKIASEGHTAIIPTGVTATGLTGNYQKLYDLINRRFRAIFAPPKKTKTVKVTAIADKENFVWSYTWNLQNGFEEILHPNYEAPAVYDNRYTEQMVLKPIEGFAKECTTKPPARFNDGSIIKSLDFETEIDGEKIEFKIGTPATRADIIDDCVRTGYLEKKKGVFYPTQIAFDVIDVMGNLPIFNYKLTAEWERNFKALQNKEDSALPEEHYIKILHEMINTIKADTKERKKNKVTATSTDLTCPKCGKPLVSKTVNTAKGKQNVFTHAEYPNDCGFTFWRDFKGATFTEKEVASLLSGKSVKKRLISNGGKPWIQELKWSESGFEFIKAE